MSNSASLKIDQEVLKLIPKQMAVDLCVLPLSKDDGAIHIAMVENYDRKILNELSFVLGKKIVVEIFPQDVLVEAIKQHYGFSNFETIKSEPEELNSEFVSLKEEEKKVEFSSDGSVVSLVNRIITDAIDMGASDIHVEPYEKQLRIRYRLDGVLHEIHQLSVNKAKPIISRLKIMADLDIAEKRRPQDGRIRVKQKNRVIDIRVSTLPTDFGEKVVLRILDKSQLQLDLSKLGFEENDLNKFKRVLHLPYGMVLVTGPTGSGKTTTLYAALNYISSPEINITTIEDPVEYNLPGINQTQVRSDIGVTFATALRAILRQDPNVIMVGEIRDGETAEIAIRSALTGHLVLSTLHTNDAPSAVTRLVDMGVEPFLVASSLKMILAQRLLRRLCNKCKMPVKPSQDIIQEIGAKNIKDNVVYYEPAGCPECNHLGYRGRTAAYEVLLLEEGLLEHIGKNVTATEVRTIAKKEGMLTLRQSALLKAERGETSLTEVVRETTQ
ncbi:MAG TPA: GspE/PulE family protein [Bacteroidota bacterium]|nr:GspE/PulE family protein [Bacteroidota bacterium]